MLRFFFALCWMTLATAAWAEEFTRTGFPSSLAGNHNGIRGIAAISANRAEAPATQNLVRVFVEPAPWGMSGCRDDAFDIPSDQEHMVSVVLQADLRMVIVDDALPIVSGVCQAVLVRGTPDQIRSARTGILTIPP